MMAGVHVDLTITGFKNPEEETVYKAYYQIYHVVDGAEYLIDKFENLGGLSGTSSIYSDGTGSTLGNTAILITSTKSEPKDAPDCRVRSPLVHLGT